MGKSRGGGGGKGRWQQVASARMNSSGVCICQGGGPDAEPDCGQWEGSLLSAYRIPPL